MNYIHWHAAWTWTRTSMWLIEAKPKPKQTVLKWIDPYPFEWITNENNQIDFSIELESRFPFNFVRSFNDMMDSENGLTYVVAGFFPILQWIFYLTMISLEWVANEDIIVVFDSHQKKMEHNGFSGNLVKFIEP